MLIKLTEEHKKRTIQAVNEYKVLLNKELSYSENLQKKDVINHYIKRINQLNNQVEAGYYDDGYYEDAFVIGG